MGWLARFGIKSYNNFTTTQTVTRYLSSKSDDDILLDRVKALRDHPDFTLTNPNRCRSLIGGFVQNPIGFHDESGSGCEFVRKLLEELDPINSSMSSRLASCLITWKKYNPNRGKLMKKELSILSKLDPISDDLYEIV